MDYGRRLLEQGGEEHCETPTSESRELEHDMGDVIVHNSAATEHIGSKRALVQEQLGLKKGQWIDDQLENAMNAFTNDSMKLRARIGLGDFDLDTVRLLQEDLTI